VVFAHGIGTYGGGGGARAEANKLRPALILGVQAPTTGRGRPLCDSREKVGAAATFSLAPADEKDPKAVVAYYRRLGEATGLPLFVQAVGNMRRGNADRDVQKHPDVPLRQGRAGEPLLRIHELREQSLDQLKVFTGNHARTMIDEMNRGISGSMPAASFADLYASVWDLWQEGKHKEAMEMFGRVSMLINEISVYGIESLKYILQFWHFEPTGPARGLTFRGHLDEKARETIRQMLDAVKPWLKV
jgi:4-hydroxy-tetrahydrodipicolinate synthase